MEIKKKDIRETLIFIAWAVSVVAVLGSLYFSEILQYEPCKLCWYQRIVMYPFAIILGIATVKRDYRITLYTMVLSLIGGSISIYHYLIQKVPFFTENAPACGRVPCTGIYINWLGFITIPFLALMAFLVIFILSLFLWRGTKED